MHIAACSTMGDLFKVARFDPSQEEEAAAGKENVNKKEEVRYEFASLFWGLKFSSTREVTWGEFRSFKLWIAWYFWLILCLILALGRCKIRYLLSWSDDVALLSRFSPSWTRKYPRRGSYRHQHQKTPKKLRLVWRRKDLNVSKAISSYLLLRLIYVYLLLNNLMANIRGERSAPALQLPPSPTHLPPPCQGGTVLWRGTNHRPNPTPPPTEGSRGHSAPV